MWEKGHLSPRLQSWPKKYLQGDWGAGRGGGREVARLGAASKFFKGFLMCSKYASSLLSSRKPCFGILLLGILAN